MCGYLLAHDDGFIEKIPLVRRMVYVELDEIIRVGYYRDWLH